MERKSKVKLRVSRLIIFQRLGSAKTPIQRWLTPTKAKKSAHNERKAVSLSQRIVQLLSGQTEAVHIVAAELVEIEQQEKIRGTKLTIEGWRPANPCASAQIAFDQARQALKERRIMFPFQFLVYPGKDRRRHRIYSIGLRSIIFIAQQGEIP